MNQKITTSTTEMVQHNNNEACSNSPSDSVQQHAPCSNKKVQNTANSEGGKEGRHPRLCSSDKKQDANNSPSNTAKCTIINAPFQASNTTSLSSKSSTGSSRSKSVHRGISTSESTSRLMNQMMMFNPHLYRGKEFSLFPSKLHQILSHPEFSHLITWLPHGCSWKVLNQKEFEELVLPFYFRHKKFSSFMRQVTGWGFKRLRKEGADRHSYYHKLFHRDFPQLCTKMKRPTDHPPSSDLDVSDDINIESNMIHNSSNQTGNFNVTSPVNITPPCFFESAHKEEVSQIMSTQGGSTPHENAQNMQNHVSMDTGADAVVPQENLGISSDSSQLSSISKRREKILQEIQAIQHRVNSICTPSPSLMLNSPAVDLSRAGMLHSYINDHHQDNTTRGILTDTSTTPYQQLVNNNLLGAVLTNPQIYQQPLALDYNIMATLLQPQQNSCIGNGVLMNNLIELGMIPNSNLPMSNSNPQLNLMMQRMNQMSNQQL